MRKYLAAFFGVLAVVFLAAAPVLACGDKLVLLGRGIRFQRMLATKHPASILVYLRPESGISAADREYHFDSLLKLAGHKPHAVTNAAEFTKELGSNSYDLVLADYSDAAGLEKEVRGSKAKPTLVPVVYNPTEAERAAAEKQYSCLVAPAKKNYEMLTVIDDAMASRGEGTGARCRKARA
jgi:hypothetical protein